MDVSKILVDLKVERERIEEGMARPPGGSEQPPPSATPAAAAVRVPRPKPKPRLPPATAAAALPLPHSKLASAISARKRSQAS
jgi:hypothetical protein